MFMRNYFASERFSRARSLAIVLLVMLSAASILPPWATCTGATSYMFSIKWMHPDPYFIDVDDSGNVYVASRYNNNIQKFNSSGALLTTWGGPGTGDGKFNDPEGIAVDSTRGFVYLTDNGNNRVQKFDLKGTFLAKWGSFGSGEGQFNAPAGIAVDDSGNVYVTDRENNRIQKFDSKGSFLIKWGSGGIGNGDFNMPESIAVDKEGNIYVGDEENNRVQKFDSKGNFAAMLGTYGSGDYQFIDPEDVAVDAIGNVYVADSDNNRIQVYNKTGSFLIRLGGPGDGDGKLSDPRGVAIDDAGNVYVADTGHSLIQKFTPLIARKNGKIAFTSERDGNTEIYIMNDDGSGQTRLTNNKFRDEYPSWSPDGTKIAFQSNRNGNWEIYVMNADGTGQTRLTNNNADDEFPDWSPNGAKIAFCSERDGNAEIYVMKADGSGQTRLTYSSTYVDIWPRWSPDGAKIAYDSDRGVHWEIYVMNADGTGDKRLTNNNIYDGGAAWSPDGTKIAFCSQLVDADGYAEIYVMNADGTGRTRLTNNNSTDEVTDWSPDGTKILFNSDRNKRADDPPIGEWGNWEVYVMNADGSRQTRLTNNVATDYATSWQSRTHATATLILQSSATNTMVDTSFNLSATLSTPKSGTVTLYWSIDGSGFNYRHDEIMTNGKFGRAFAASSPGTWAFKVVWTGDDEYESAESNNVTVTIKALPALAAAASASPATVYSGGSSTIRATLKSGGAAVTGATVNLTSSNGGTFSTVSDKGNGTYVATFTAPDIVTQTLCTIAVSASKSGYLGGSGQTQVTVQPLVLTIIVKWSDGTPITGVALASTSQPSGQTALSGTTDANGQVSFSNVLKGAYTFKATKSGYDDKTWTLNVQGGQATTETITLVKPSGGIPGYPLLSVTLALLAATIILYRGKQMLVRPVKHQ